MGFVTSDLRLVRTPAKDHPSGSKRAVFAFSNAYPRLVAAGRNPLYDPKAGQNHSVVLGYIPQASMRRAGRAPRRLFGRKRGTPSAPSPLESF